MAIGLNIGLCAGACTFLQAIGVGALSGAMATGSLKGIINGAVSAGIFHGIGTFFESVKYSNFNNAYSQALKNGKSSLDA
ncbi:hypothetical protein ACUR5C_04585 [Aliikangiella sp. IMCC44653]